MELYRKEYEKKLRPLEAVYDLVEDGDYIVNGRVGCNPSAFLKQLHTIADRVNNITVALSLELGRYEFLDPPYNEKFHVYNSFILGPWREDVAKGNVGFIPCNMHNGATRELQCFDPDVFVCAVCPMDEQGFFRTSMSAIAEDEYRRKAKKIILEVVPSMPVIFGDNVIHISEVDAVFEADHALPMISGAPLTEADMAIGRYVASLVEDGSTVQLGIGAIPDAVAQSFMDKHDLGIHTEMLTNSLVDLVEAGVITGRYKTLHRCKLVGSFALGNERLYKFLDRNPQAAIMPADYVNDPNVICKNDKMVSINTAIAVDFTGQVASESIGPRQYSGSGGQTDTAVGAIHSKGGKSIIALHSTAKKGTISTINNFLPQGAVVTLSRNNIDYIVTEYGIAQMKQRSTAERAAALINIAHPDFRAELTAQAKALNFI